MNSTRIISFTLCLGLACLLMMGNALAGTTEAAEVEYAREVGGADTQYTIPNGNMIMRTLSILPSASFFLKVSLDGNAEFDNEVAGGLLPANDDLMLSAGGRAELFGVPEDGATSVEYLVTAGSNFTQYPVLTFDTGGWGIEDPDNVLGGGGTINVTVTTRAANTGATIDTGTDSDAWLKGVAGVTVIKDSLKSTTATVDVATARTEFAAVNGDTADMDKGATLGLSDMTAMALAADGTTYELAATDTIELVVTGDLTGITEIVWNDGDDMAVDGVEGSEVRLAQSDKGFDLANGVATLKLAGDNGGIDRMEGEDGSMVGVVGTITIIVDGSTTLNSRTLNLAVKLDLSGAANDRELVSTSLTVWELNGTVFLANFVNGNNEIFHSRVYLFNHGPVSGDITVRAFTLPTSGDSTLVGTANLGSLMSWSGRNIRVAEDVLMHMTDLPYTADGGNLVLEITINANDIAGTAQVFQHDLSSFGIYQLKSIN
jgi:hypothetical protein